eukprot:jgi/Mesen1/567/ME000107S10803
MSLMAKISLLVLFCFACVFSSSNASSEKRPFLHRVTHRLAYPARHIQLNSNSESERNTLHPAPVCKALECPPYSLVHEESDFEIRHYAESTWMQAGPLQDVSFMKATTRGFHSLFEYIEGENVNETHVPMTAPAITSIVPSAGPFCSSAFSVRLYLPAKYQESPPTPKPHLQLKVAQYPSRCVAVRKFGGFASDFNVAQEAASLADSLERTPWAGATKAERGADEEAYSIAQYNSPFELLKRVNEVWVTIPDDIVDDECQAKAK